MAADTEPLEILLHLPLLAEDKVIYLFIYFYFLLMGFGCFFFMFEFLLFWMQFLLSGKLVCCVWNSIKRM
jgi:hypothetical protein